MKIVSCILNFHRERYLAHSMLISFRESLIQAVKNTSLDFEIVAVLDNADFLTTKIVTQFLESLNIRGISIFQTSFGDVALPRNFGIEKARGEIISIFDGDDLYSLNYISQVAKTALKNPNSVVHPEILYSFGKNESIMFMPDSKDIPLSDFFSYNPYQSSVTSSKKIFLECPFKRNSPGIGFEDWTFNCDALAAGYSHVPAKGTIRFYRCGTAGGALDKQRAENCIPGFSPLWTPSFLDADNEKEEA